MIFESLDYFVLESIITLFVGALGGTFAQIVSLRLKYNGQWDKISAGRKVSMVFTGTLASLVIGLHLIDSEYAQGKSLATIIWRLWAYQLMAGWSGGIVMSLLESYIFKPSNSNRHKGNNVVTTALLPDRTLQAGQNGSETTIVDDKGDGDATAEDGE